MFLTVCLAAGKVWRAVVRKRLMKTPLPGSWVDIIERNMTFYKRMPAELQYRLGGLVQVFLSEKNFIGCRGLEITDQVRVTIAAQACVLLLNRRHNFFPRLKTIYVYPCPYIAATRTNVGGITVEDQIVRTGESWKGGPVVLAWDSVKGSARNSDGVNVVLHEFAHQLDQENGDADGIPQLESVSCYRTWAQVLGGEYQKLRSSDACGSDGILREYAATNAAEFFAVATEAFFERSAQLSTGHPELYEQLKGFYRLNPLEWRMV